MSHKGSIFEQEISRSLRRLDNSWYHRFPNRKWAAHPFDHLLISPDQDYGIELKSTQDPSWRMEDLRDKQKRALLWFQRIRGCTSLVMINYRQGRGDIEAYSMRIEELLRIIEVMREEKERKSISRDYLEKEKRVHKLERISIKDSYGWDLSLLL